MHSHDFNRHLTPFKAEFDPKDHRERLVVIGRYISESIGGVALHPVDVMDAATGQLLAELVDPNLTTISPVNKPHPRLDVVISGSSRSLYAWRPVEDDEALTHGVGMVHAAVIHGLLASCDTVRGAAEGPSTPSAPRGAARFVAFDVDDDRKKAARRSSTGDEGPKKKHRGGNKDNDTPPGRRAS